MKAAGTIPVKTRLGKTITMAVPALALASLLAAAMYARSEPPGAAAPRPVHAVLARKWYLGVREPAAPPSWAPVSHFAAEVGKRPGIVLYYSGWREPFQTAYAREAWKHGAVLLVQMQPWGARLRYLARGGYDGYLRSFASQVRRFGHQVIIGFGHEMNGPWYPWGAGHVPPSVFVAAWRQVVTVFRHEGADNVTWLWTTHETGDAAQLRAYWPGGRYVDWVGIDGYFEFPDSTFGMLFGRAARAVRTFTRKPILISETAVGPRAGNSAIKIRELFTGARRDHFLGLVWFDVAQHDPPYHQDWRLEGRHVALAQFRKCAGADDC